MFFFFVFFKKNSTNYSVVEKDVAAQLVDFLAELAMSVPAASKVVNLATWTSNVLRADRCSG